MSARKTGKFAAHWAFLTPTMGPMTSLSFPRYGAWTPLFTKVCALNLTLTLFPRQTVIMRLSGPNQARSM